MAIMRIQELRVKAGMTQATLGVQMGVAQCVISEWEHEVYLPKARQLPELARLLGVAINDLFTSDMLEEYEMGFTKEEAQ